MFFRRQQILSLAFLFLACSESSFKGENGSGAPAATPSNLNQQPAAGTCDMQRDFVALEGLPDDIKNCEAGGGFYFYLDRRCYNFPSQRQSCSFAQVKQWLQMYKISTATVSDGEAKNAKIIDCRHIPEKKTVTVNWWFTAGDLQNCNYNENLRLVTACYRVLPPGSSVTNVNPQTKEEHAMMARDCLGAL